MPAANCAVTALAEVMVTLQVVIPLQMPVQPLKKDPVDGFAMTLMQLAVLKVLVQVVPLEMPDGPLVTVPLPVPA